MARVFAGPLSRYHARGGGDLLRLQQGVEVWRNDLAQALGGRMAAELVWDEAAAAVADLELGAAGWMGLRLFAFYAERSDLEMPDTVPALLELDRDWRAAAEGRFERSLYGQLLACRLWLPGDFPLTMRAPLPDGDSGEIGSVTVLLDQLRFLNRRTFAADEPAIAGWRSLPAPPGAPLLDAARAGFAGLWTAARAAVGARLPLVVTEV